MEDISGKVEDLAELVEYQAGNVVSRAIIKKDTGTVTIFAFGKGEGLSEHTAPFDALVYILDGVSEITISGVAHVVKKGQMLIMPAGKSHSLKAKENFKMMLIMIRQ